MLGLSFKEGEIVAIGTEISVKVYTMEGHRRKFIVNAPAEITALRSTVELAEEQDEGREDFGNLVLTMSQGESIDFYLAGELLGKVHIVKCANTTRLGFEFPLEFTVLRENLIVEEFNAPNSSAAITNPMILSVLEL